MTLTWIGCARGDGTDEFAAAVAMQWRLDLPQVKVALHHVLSTSEKSEYPAFMFLILVCVGTFLFDLRGDPYFSGPTNWTWCWSTWSARIK